MFNLYPSVFVPYLGLLIANSLAIIIVHIMAIRIWN